jgi:biotin carboxylase
MRPRIVLVMPNTAYRADDFVAAAERAGAEVLVASDRCHVLDGVWRWPETSIVVDVHDPAGAAATIAARAPGAAAVIGTEGELAALVAALAAQELGLPHNPVAAAEAARDKHLMLARCADAGVPVPRHALVPAVAGRGADAGSPVGYPCVLKPTFLSASRGVIRADDDAGFAAARARIARLLAIPEVRALAPPGAAGRILVEAFVPGPEVAVEALLGDGTLQLLALFDKPDPLDGPFFEETIYVTPSRHPAAVQRAVLETTAAAARAMGLATGPVHAELRLAPHPVVIEVAARSIGGLCARTLRFGAGLSLEDVLVRHALGQPAAALGEREHAASGVMMIPIPAAGVLREVIGLPRARAVPGVVDVVITAPLEKELVPLPEGASYLGFLFARGATPAEVETALREAHRRLELRITPVLPTATATPSGSA